MEGTKWKKTTQVFPEGFEAELLKTQIRPKHGNTAYTAQGIEQCSTGGFVILSSIEGAV